MITRKNISKFFHSRIFSVIALLILIGIMYFFAMNLTKKYHKVPDFCGIIMLRQTNIGLNDHLPPDLILTREKIQDHITSAKVLLPIAEQYGWNIPEKEMLKAITVKEQQESFRCFVICVNTQENIRSIKVARALAADFLKQYKIRWKKESLQILRECQFKIKTNENELKKLRALRKKFTAANDLQPANNELEMQAVNEQLIMAQNEFLKAYGAYIGSIEEKRIQTQQKYDLASKIYTSKDQTVITLKRELDELDRQCLELRKKLNGQKPDLYKLSAEPKKLTGLPSHILFYYDNVQTLQQLKLSLMLKSLIEEKEKTLENERNNQRTIKRLLDNDSCDVFIREI